MSVGGVSLCFNDKIVCVKMFATKYTTLWSKGLAGDWLFLENCLRIRMTLESESCAGMRGQVADSNKSTERHWSSTHHSVSLLYRTNHNTVCSRLPLYACALAISEILSFKCELSCISIGIAGSQWVLRVKNGPMMSCTVNRKDQQGHGPWRARPSFLLMDVYADAQWMFSQDTCVR